MLIERLYFPNKANLELDSSRHGAGSEI